MEHPKFTILVWTISTNPEYFREFLQSVAEQDYDNFELIILDDNVVSDLETLAFEYLPAEKINYRKLKKHVSRAYAHNVGMHFANGDYIVLAGQHDTLSPIALQKMAEVIEKNAVVTKEIEKTAEDIDLIYTDHDELVDDSRMNPHFKPDLNKGLLLQQNYIGDFICFRRFLMAKTGHFNEDRHEADIYEFLIRSLDAKVSFCHIPMLLFHRRMQTVPDNSAYRAMVENAYNEYALVAREYYKRHKIAVKVEKDSQYRYWKASFNGQDAVAKKNDYILLQGKKVKVNAKRKAIEKMYGALKQPDVAVVGVRFMQGTFTIDNCGYIFDQDGIVYPACYNQKTYHEDYDFRTALSQDVSMVDFGFAMLDANVFKHLHGFNGELTGRDIVLDYCFRVRKAGYRVLYLNDVTARYKDKNTESSEISNMRLKEIWGDVLSQGDPYYNENLILGTENYTL